jgi:hypothetical protein
LKCLARKKEDSPQGCVASHKALDEPIRLRTDEHSRSYLLVLYIPSFLKIIILGRAIKKTYSLLEDSDLEAIEVRSVSSGFFGSQFLAPSAVGKLGLDVRSSDGLGQQGLSGVTRNLDDVISKAQTLEVNSLALNTSDGLRTINKGLWDNELIKK